jgi:tetratricopeptide (TPR) repeat protein
MLSLTIACFLVGGCQQKPSPHPYKQIAEYKERLKQNPGDVEALVGLGRAYVDLERLDTALQAYHKAVAADSSYFHAHHELGITLRKLDRYDEALGVLKTAITLNPESAQAHNSLGLVYYKSGSRQEALETFQEALRLDPGCAEAHYNLGAIYRELKEYDKASRHWQKYNELQKERR